MWVARSSSMGCDAIGLELFFKFKASKLWATVMKTSQELREMAKPSMVEDTGNGDSFLVGKCKKFDIVCCWVNHGEGNQGEGMGGRTVHDVGGRAGWSLREGPWSNQVDMNGCPRL
jgi:hypothetical protein